MPNSVQTFCSAALTLSGVMGSCSTAAPTASQRPQSPLAPEPTGEDPVLPTLHGVRAVVFDVYGTMLVSGSGDISLASEAGLEVENGIVVDEYARTSDPAIFAAGDCTNFPSPRYGRRMRLESVPNAIEQAKAAAANMIGGDVVYDALPWFWSDQYDVKLQIAGLNTGYDRVVARLGSGQTASFWYYAGDRLLAVDVDQLNT